MACARLSCCATPLARINPVGPPVALRAAQFRVPRGMPASGLCTSPGTRQRWRVASSSEGKDAPSEAMSVEEALVILDVAENASFEQIVAAKNAKISEGSVATSKVRCTPTPTSRFPSRLPPAHISVPPASAATGGRGVRRDANAEHEAASKRASGHHCPVRGRPQVQAPAEGERA